MTQSPSYPSSHGSDSSNANQDTPNTGMHMGQFPWPHPAHMHHPGYPPAPPCFPYGVPPPYAHAGVVHHAPQARQHGQFPPAVTHVSHATHVGPPLTTAPFPPQHPSAPPMYHQPFPSGHFPGVMTSYTTHTSYQPYLHQQHGAGLVTGSASPSLPQGPGLSVGEKRVAENFQGRNVRRIKKRSDRIEDDPLFKPMLDQHGQHDGRYVCSKDGQLVRPPSYKRHLKTEKHLGHKPTEFTCPSCLETYARGDICKKHWDDKCGKLAANSRLSYAAACQALTSLNSALATTSFMPPLPATATTASHSSPPEIIPTDATNPDSWAARDIQDPPLVAPALPPSEGQDIALAEVHDTLVADAMQEPPLVTPVRPPSEVREITLEEVRGCVPFWRWINDTEGLVDPLPPIAEPPSPRLPETMLVDAAEDPDV